MVASMVYIPLPRARRFREQLESGRRALVNHDGTLGQ